MAWMGGRIVRYAGVGSLDMSWLPLPMLVGREQWVLQCLGGGEANGGGNDMAVGPTVVASLGLGEAQHSAQ
jgi:hypothetical protein